MLTKTKLAKLIELHSMAKEHPFRLGRMGDAKNYQETLRLLGTEFIRLVEQSFAKSKIKNPFDQWIWGHQYWTCIWGLRPDHQLEEYMAIMESYLETIHAFYESDGQLHFFYMHVGYCTYSKKQHDDHPMRSLKFIYYPQLGFYDVTKLHAKAELAYYKRWLRESQAGLKKAQKKFAARSEEEKKKNWITRRWGMEYHETRIKWHRKRIRILTKILTFE